MCVTAANVDDDMDGFSEDQGDCNDCDPNVNPGAIEVIPDSGSGGSGGGMYVPADEDCDGTPDNPPGPCDDNLALEDPDPWSAARSIELCQQATPGGQDFGVLSALWVRANGTPAVVPSQQFGILSDFGPNVNVQGGTRFLGLSSGRARLPGQPNACGTYSCYQSGPGAAPPGFPQDVPNCPGETEINDDVALEVNLRAPTNATGYKFNFKFYSFEYPEWVCDFYNDQFIALVNPPPMGSINGNISFDSMGNPVSVNVAFFDVCQGCPLGTAEMIGTGFDIWELTIDDAGGTSWLATTAPIGGGEEFSIRFAIWDTGDQSWDSTAVVDNFQWIANGGTVVVGTEPEEEPQ
jgi:hypothetical protein